jgi:gamma-glutamyl:cysteine ligase YbdK (ATP-grasp superfamily)
VGLAIDRDRFDEAEYARFAERLDQCLAALDQLLQRRGFGQQSCTLGAELELFLVDESGLPVPRNKEVQATAQDPRVTLELVRFNLELNPRPVPVAGRPFSALGGEVADLLSLVRRAASDHATRVAVIGILPTLRPEDLDRMAITDAPRYRALDFSVRRLRQRPFHVSIEGQERLDITSPHVALEGANTSFQLHLRIAPERLARTFNAVQLATGPVLAAAGNSPTLFGRWLWEETRIALFEQAVDHRDGEAGNLQPARVTFGRQWVRDGALELFVESVRSHEPLLPILSDEDPLDHLAGGSTPHLDELRLHQGTVWQWNRVIYDGADGGHLRIEMRALPAGPTLVDMLANAAFLVGLALALAPTADAWSDTIPFQCLRDNFYDAARRGLDAVLAWPSLSGDVLMHPAADLVPRLLPLARQGLRDAGVASPECDLLDVILARVRTGQTGSAWQRRRGTALEPRYGRDGALVRTFQRYLELADSGQPVHAWPA